MASNLRRKGTHTRTLIAQGLINARLDVLAHAQCGTLTRTYVLRAYAQAHYEWQHATSRYGMAYAQGLSSGYAHALRTLTPAHMPASATYTRDTPARVSVRHG